MYNDLLTAFVCVADCGSFNKASEKLFLSSTSIMKQINALEKHLDVQLMERTNQGITLTEAGKIIYKHAKHLFRYSEKVIAEAKNAMNLSETTFCVGTSILNPCKPFMDLWYQINESFPDYKLHIVPFEDNHENILGELSLMGEKFDFVVAACDSELWLNRCNFYPLGTCKHCCAVSRTHRLAKKEHLTIEDFYDETLMIVKRGDSATVDTIRDLLKQHDRILLEDTPQFYDMEVFNRCAQTQNIMLTLDCWKDVHPSLVTIPVVWDFQIPYGLLYPQHPSEDIRKVLTELEKILIVKTTE